LWSLASHNPAEIKGISRIRCDCSPRYGHRHFNRFLVSLGQCAESRCHVLLIRASAVMSPTTSIKREGRILCPAYACPGGYRDLSVSGRWLSPGLFILAVFYVVYFMRSILLPIESEISRYLFTITAIKACLALAVGTGWDRSVRATRFITLMERCA
jgi:hypothetical protein